MILSTHRKVAAAFALVFLQLLSFSSERISRADDSRFVSTATREGRLAVFDDVWETIAERYYDPSFRGLDWSSRRTLFRPLAAEAVSTQQFYDVLRRMIAPLKDAHTRVYSPDEKFDWWKPTFVNVGLSMREIDDKITVVQVESSSPARRAGIRQGDVLRQIDDAPVERIVANRLKDLGFEPDEPTRLRVVTTLLEGSSGSPVRITWENHEGRIKSAVLNRERIERVLGFQIRNDHNWTTVRIDAFTPRVASELAAAMSRELKKAKGFILDLRANGGGDAEAMAEVASFFLPAGTSLGKFSDRGGSSFELRTSGRFIPEVEARLNTKVPLVVLTSESTSSAAEILAAALQKHRRAQLIGTRTCGCVLAIRNRHSLPDGGVLDVSELDYWTSDGVRLEGAGVIPDSVVKAHRSDLYARKDAALEYARATLRGLAR